MKNITNLVGLKFSKLLVVSLSKKSYPGKVLWDCICDCGNTTTSSGSNLKHGISKTCGCSRKGNKNQIRTHGMTGSDIYRRWQAMKSRCDNPNATGYDSYGGRGISYSPEWAYFENFYQDMFEGFSKELDLDRIDPNGNYCKENCRWVDTCESAFNTRRPKDNKSGKTGVYFDRGSNSWRVAINYKRSKKLIGGFKSFEDAVEFRELFEMEIYGYIKP